MKLAQERGGATWREIASSAEVRVDGPGVAGESVQRGVAPSLARQTVKNMVHAGELAEVGRQKAAGSTHWHALYAPASMSVSPEVVDGRELGQLMTSWAR
jgi:hypothetical protein